MFVDGVLKLQDTSVGYPARMARRTWRGLMTRGSPTPAAVCFSARTPKTAPRRERPSRRARGKQSAAVPSTFDRAGRLRASSTECLRRFGRLPRTERATRWTRAAEARRQLRRREMLRRGRRARRRLTVPRSPSTSSDAPWRPWGVYALRSAEPEACSACLHVRRLRHRRVRDEGCRRRRRTYEGVHRHTFTRNDAFAVLRDGLISVEVLAVGGGGGGAAVANGAGGAGGGGGGGVPPTTIPTVSKGDAFEVGRGDGVVRAERRRPSSRRERRAERLRALRSRRERLRERRSHETGVRVLRRAPPRDAAGGDAALFCRSDDEPIDSNWRLRPSARCPRCGRHARTREWRRACVWDEGCSAGSATGGDASPRRSSSRGATRSFATRAAAAARRMATRDRRRVRRPPSQAGASDVGKPSPTQPNGYAIARPFGERSRPLERRSTQSAATCARDAARLVAKASAKRATRSLSSALRQAEAEGTRLRRRATFRIADSNCGRCGRKRLRRKRFFFVAAKPRPFREQERQQDVRARVRRGCLALVAHELGGGGGAAPEADGVAISWRRGAAVDGSLRRRDVDDAVKRRVFRALAIVSAALAARSARRSAASNAASLPPRRGDVLGVESLRRRRRRLVLTPIVSRRRRRARGRRPSPRATARRRPAARARVPRLAGGVAERRSRRARAGCAAQSRELARAVYMEDAFSFSAFSSELPLASATSGSGTGPVDVPLRDRSRHRPPPRASSPSPQAGAAPPRPPRLADEAPRGAPRGPRALARPRCWAARRRGP